MRDSIKVLIIVTLLSKISLIPSSAQMVTGRSMTDFQKTFGVSKDEGSLNYRVVPIESSVSGNILFPGEQPKFTLQFVNIGTSPLPKTGKIDIIAYGTKGKPGDVWVPTVFKIADLTPLSIDLNIPAKGFQNITISPKLPARYGAYAFVADLGPLGRHFITSVVRTFPASAKRIQYPKFCLDDINLNVLKRLGVQAIRYGIGYKPTSDNDFAEWYANEGKKLKAFQDANIAVLFMIGGGDYFHPNQPLGRPRPWLDDKGVMKDTKFDLAWLPSYDDDFQRFTRKFAADYGWPKGPLNAFSLWNEPWEGISISGWGADMMRYREIYTHMAMGVDQARKEDGVDVLIGGCDSSTNALDKLFGDGTDDFLKWFDFCSIHYQGLSPHSNYKKWVNRIGPNGRVKIWDTESWVANTDDRVAAVIAANRAAGYDRAMGIFGGNIAEDFEYDVRQPDGKSKRVSQVTVWPVAASIGAAQHFIGERNFKHLLFQNGLPWVMEFEGLTSENKKPDTEDGTLVVVGDLGEEFGADNVWFRTARGLNEVADKAAILARIVALPQGATEKERKSLQQSLAKYEVLSGASLSLSGSSSYSLFDFYGNPVQAKGSHIVVPLDGRGFFLRGNGKPGSFAKLIEAVMRARVDGIEPLATVAHDLTKRIENKPALRLTLTNILNRPVSGKVVVTLGKLTLDYPKHLTFKANETREIAVKVTAGTAVANNTYPLEFRFDPGNGIIVVHHEEMHVCVIAKKSITVDGDLRDWKDVPPQTIVSPESSSPSLTESAWFPFKSFDTGVKAGFAAGYLAYDSDYFYFAAKVADSTPDAGMVRFETRDENEFFYPKKSYVKRITNPGIAPMRDSDTETPKELDWPEGVRQYTYRMDPELPSGNFPGHDNIQIAFNVLDSKDKPYYPTSPGTMPGFISYKDTDYEYALNPIAAKYGGGVEIWRLEVPGMPHKQFYPRQGASPKDGPVKDGKLVIKRDGNTLLVECAIPWSELQDVKKRMDTGQNIKFSFRVNDNHGGGCMELSRDRSVARRNISFHCDWVEHWANEIEFGFEK